MTHDPPDRMNAHQFELKKKRHFVRLFFVFLMFGIILCILIARMVDLTVLHRQFLKAHGDARSLRVIPIPAHRGRIMDRNGATLAASTPVESIWIQPQEFSPEPKQLKRLSTLIDVSPAAILKTVERAKGKEFVYLKRQLPPAQTKKIQDLKVQGVNFQQEFKRYYPDGETISQLLGFTNIDDQGIEGLELAYHEWLKGIPGKRRVLKDRMGQVIEDLGLISEGKAGNALQLSLDRRLQYVAYNELNKTLQEHEAKSGTVVVLDTKTGEILAMVNAPSYNPNARGQYTRDSYRNRALTDIFEPGSVIKPFSIASALETGLFKPDTILDTNPGFMRVQKGLVKDIHNYGVLDVTGVLRHSSNVGVSTMVLASPPEIFTGLLQRCGFGQRTESLYPGESEGSIVHPKDAKPFVLATLSFGYGMTVNALQLAKAYLIFANQGAIRPVTLIHNDTNAATVPVIKPETANALLSMLEESGKKAKIPGYRIAGKTGTAIIAGKQGYKEKKYIASFIGIAPVSNPRLIVAVIIHEPTKKGYYAVTVAVPLFSKVMGEALRMFDIPPDKPEEGA